MTISEEKIGEILAPVSVGKQESRREKVRSKFWSKARGAAKSIPMMDEVIAAYFCAMDNNTPIKVRGTLLAALAYFILPLDLFPDFIFGFGFTDDIAVIMAAIGAVRAHITDAHRALAVKALENDLSDQN